MTSSALQKYLDQLQGLFDVSTESARRFIVEDRLFVAHVNLFVKSYIITLCSILESYLKEEVLSFVDEVSQLIDGLALSKNIIVWGIAPHNDALYEKQVGRGIQPLRLGIDDNVVDDSVSGNVDRTIKAFRRCGIDITKCKEFSALKTVISNIVTKRNSVVHHSIRATDFTYNDIANWTLQIKTYIEGISSFVNIARRPNTEHLYVISGTQRGLEE